MICLLGESASGKSTTEKILVDNYGMKKVISYTTRKPRENEKDGVDYHFVTDDYFNELKKKGTFVETAFYNGWQYGTAKNDFKDKYVVHVITPYGLRQFRKTNLDVYAFYIKVERRDRLIKILQRGDNIEESIRRNITDIGAFDGIEDECVVIENLNYEKTPEDLAHIIWDSVFCPN